MLGRAWVSAYTEQDEVFVAPEDLIGKILHCRGIDGDAERARFLNPSIKEYMPDPSILRDMDVAAAIIADHITCLLYTSPSPRDM